MPVAESWEKKLKKRKKVSWRRVEPVTSHCETWFMALSEFSLGCRTARKQNANLHPLARHGNTLVSTQGLCLVPLFLPLTGATRRHIDTGQRICSGNCRIYPENHWKWIRVSCTLSEIFLVSNKMKYPTWIDFQIFLYCIIPLYWVTFAFTRELYP